MDAVADDIHVSQVVDLSATAIVAEGEEDKKGPYSSIFSSFSSLLREEVSTTFTTAFYISWLGHADGIYYASAASSTAVE